METCYIENIYVFLCVLTLVYMLQMHAVFTGVRKGLGSPGTRVTEACELPRGCWEQNPDPKRALSALNC